MKTLLSLFLVIAFITSLAPADQRIVDQSVRDSLEGEVSADWQKPVVELIMNIAKAGENFGKNTSSWLLGVVIIGLHLIPKTDSLVAFTYLLYEKVRYR